MKFNYSRKYLKKQLIVAIIQVCLMVVFFILFADELWLQLIFPICGLIFIYSYYREKKGTYLLLEKDMLLIQNFFSYKKIQVSKYLEISKIEDSLILKNGTENQKISTWQLENNTKDVLYSELSKMLSKA